MQVIKAEELTRDAFAPFGDVLEMPVEPGRATFDRSLSNGRSDATLSLALVQKLPVSMPLISITMERHPWSSQTFLPISAYRWLVVVAPPSVSGPDMTRALAFVVTKDQGVTFAANVWHHPFTVLDGAARFAVAIFRNGGEGDEEFFQVAPFQVQL